MSTYDRSPRAGAARANRYDEITSRIIVRAASPASAAADWISSFLPDADIIDRRAAA